MRPARAAWAGAPSGSGASGNIELALALTTCIWSYVPSLLVAELAYEMDEPSKLRYSIVLSGIVNAIIFMVVGLSVVGVWGVDVADPITLSSWWPKRGPCRPHRH